MTRRAPGRATLHFLLGAASIALVGCSDDNPTGPTGSSSITLDLQGLRPISDGLNYQAWVVVQGPGQSYYGYPLVLFNVDGDGNMVDPVSNAALPGPFPAEVAPAAVLGLGISLELSDEPVQSSSNTFILGGPNNNGTVTFAIADWLGIGVDLSGADGSFVLGALTDGAPDQQLSGLWFLNPGTVQQPGLILPIAPEGWDYEGWVVVDGTPLSTGKFYLMDAPDGSNQYSADATGPAFPGEDFLTNAPTGVTFPTDLTGAEVFLTLEPWQGWDASPETPFFLRVLEGMVPSDAAPMTSYSLTSLFDQLPSGSATVS